MPVSAHDVVRELRRRLASPGSVKIHKLLYYCQGWHLAWTGRPLFTETIEAWANGPVVASLWRDEHHGEAPPRPVALDDVASNVVGYVVSRYGRLSGRQLIRLTHAENPWLDVSEREAWDQEIGEEALARFFLSDDDAARAGEVLSLALEDERTGPILTEAIARVGASPGEIDDPAEIRRRLHALR
jgi:uncharacterized phage-associated protein